MLVLVTILLVGFLARSGAERSAGAAYHATAAAGMLAGTAVNLVESQINEAIANTGGSTGCVWCSQPGAVRVYDKTGHVKTIYRLYSAGALQAGTAAELATNDLPTAPVWKNAPAVWTDLNEPETVFGLKDASGRALDNAGQGSRVYPILDARDPMSDLSSPANTRYLDAKTDEWGENWGFAINADPAANPVGATAAAPCLPVRWIYVLQDGNLAAPIPGGNGSTAVRIPGATAQNPVVGRVAFWTDDECCKVNVNTAAGSRGRRPYQGDGSGRPLPLPAPWDTPRFKIFDERLLFSENQPVRGEFQRYPGHPATTDLFNLWNVLGMTGDDYPFATNAYTDPVSAQPTPGPTPSGYFQRLPRYADDSSSQGGTRNTTGSVLATSMNQGVPKSNRFYTSLGEMLYDAARNPSGVSRQQVESGKFFLTAHSRAPDETLYGTPRVAMWPVDADPGKRTAYDQYLAFCATAGQNPDLASYFVQRGNANDPTSDWDNVARNGRLYQYLQSLTGAEVPGFGGTLSAKYGAERDQILTEMFDYVRATNLTDHSGGSTGGGSAAFTSLNPGQVVPLKIGQTRGLGRIPTLSEIGLLLICTADGNSPLPYRPPVTISGYTSPVSPVVGSANDPLYVSNLPVTQFLRDASSHIVGSNAANSSPFPANKTLADVYAAADPGDTHRLAAGTKRFQAMLLLETVCPMLGYDPMTGTNNYQIAASGLHGITIAGQNPFPGRVTTDTPTASANLNGDGLVHGGTARVGTIQNYGGLTGFRSLLTSYKTYAAGRNTYQYNQVYNAWSGYDPAGKATLPYRFISNPFTVTTAANGQMSLSGGCTLQLQVPLAGSAPVTYQTFNVNFPALANLPTPDLPKNGIGYQRTSNSVTTTVTTNAADWWSFDNRIAWTVYPNKVAATGDASFQPYLDGQKPNPYLGPGCVIRADNPLVGKWNYLSTYTTPVYVPTQGAAAGSSDVVRTLVARDGDYRLTSALDTVDASGTGAAVFVKSPGYDDGGKLADLFVDQGSSSGTAGIAVGGKLVDQADYAPWFAPKVPATLDHDKQLSWDWDSGLPWEADGAYANKPDEGNTFVGSGTDSDATGLGSPYYARPGQASNELGSYFTANRIVPSPVMFGSLPTGVPVGGLAANTWRTLLFRPQANRPAYAALPGPPDHLWLDLFTMPVVEPYAISEPFSTAGRINMNYQIEPFTFITRDTGMRAVLASELVAQVPLAAAGAGADGTCGYKGSPTVSAPAAGTPQAQRLPLSFDESMGTLQQFEERFRQGDLFRSASEICDLYLVPRGYSLPAFKDTWYGDDFALVGDNVRERPYGDIYPRLTTRSNTFTVHYRVQVLRSPDAVSPDPARASQWDERRGAIIGEARGSATIERFLDPGRTDLPDYTATPFAQPLDHFHEWRVVATNRFPP